MSNISETAIEKSAEKLYNRTVAHFISYDPREADIRPSWENLPEYDKAQYREVVIPYLEDALEILRGEDG